MKCKHTDYGVRWTGIGAERKGIVRESTGGISSLGGLAAALGIGAWLASVPWMAAADTGSAGSDAAALDPVPVFSGAAADPSGLNIDVSYNGNDLFQMGDAVAHSGAGDLAIAYGAGATADAGYGTTASGVSLAGTGDDAFANGAGSTAIAGGGPFDSATATDGATAYSGFEHTAAGPLSFTVDHDLASASGAGSVADAAGQGFNTATASAGGTADAGLASAADQGGLFDFASANGADSTAAAGLGQNDIAEVFGSMLTANATGGNGLFDIEPGGLTNVTADAATAAVPSDDLGLSSLLADFNWLGL